MGWLAMALIALAGWLIWTGRLQRMTVKDGMALGAALVGAVMAAKGKPVAALPMLVGSALYFLARSRKGKAWRKAATLPATDEQLARARALLGLPPEADARAVKAAHRRLIASVHPDRGGTEALAAEINAARDLLLRHLKGGDDPDRA
ncbi:J domain-containing protein [Sphingobium cloacae]|uniref:Molecular chaperone DnaJ n=1 Tax=Sphingobium cloacae TaxID=120107 RepID=A0A1E1F468_9SPHN|nr:J domain-containing protein [Sphingobium cloacae]BAV65252.1 molecular chaperone DnaJ [Sphingobium cloacae]